MPQYLKNATFMFTFAQQRSRDNILVPRGILGQLQLFLRKPELIRTGTYAIQSDVLPEVVSLFFGRVGGDKTKVVTAENAGQLRALCDELGFSGFDDELRALLDDDSNVRTDRVCMRGRIDRHDMIIEELQRRVFELERQLRGQQAVLERIKALETRVEEIRRNDVEGAIAEVRREVSDMREEVHRLVSDKASVVDVRALFEEVARLKEAEKKRRTCLYKAARPLDGIIARLTHVYGGNVHRNGVVQITASSVARGDMGPENAVELGTDSCFCSRSEPNSWICCDFRKRRVALVSYSIRSPRAPSCPKSWVLEVSNDGIVWQVVDHRENNEHLKCACVTHNFDIRAPLRESFRFVRLRNTGKNHDANDHLHLSSLELFGTLSSL